MNRLAVFAEQSARIANEKVDEKIRAQVRRVLSGLYSVGRVEQRRTQRFAYPRLITLVPVAADGTTPCAEPFVVAGKCLSEGGMSFFHPEPLPYRTVVAALEDLGKEPQGILIDLDWCRFTRQGWYESGGRFLRLVTLDGALLGREQRCSA